MKKAIEIARVGIELGQSPFGSVVVRNGELVALAHNTVWKDTDSTAHAEINVLRKACKTLGTIDLTGCELYSTCEPCPMCLSAIHWAKINKVYFGATIEDASITGFKELFIAAKDMVRLGKSELIVEDGLLQTECKVLFDEFLSCKKAQVY